MTASSIYTCPMHPEVRQDGPGNCPKCGMALEPLIAALGDEDSQLEELNYMKRRFWTAAIFTLPVVVIAMGDLLPGSPVSNLISAKMKAWAEFVFATPVCLCHSCLSLGGLAFLYKGSNVYKK